MPDAYSLHRDGDCNSYSCPVCAQECQHEHTTTHIDELGMMSMGVVEEGIEVHAHITASHVACDDCGATLATNRYIDPHTLKETLP